LEKKGKKKNNVWQSFLIFIFFLNSKNKFFI
jgi:hypothetical protein